MEPKEAETKTAAGLYIPDTAKEKPQQGTVLAVGPGKKDEPMEVKAGDVVLYGKYAGTEVQYFNNNGYGVGVSDSRCRIIKRRKILWQKI